jgi:hypothetical protein
MKTLTFLLILIICFVNIACEKENPQPQTIETKTGLETESATQQEVDTLTNKMDKLMESTQP